MASPHLFLALISAAALLTFASAQETDAPPATPAMREVSPGIFEMGKIRLDRKTRTVRFPGILNMTEGIIEYLLVTDQGSTHESLLVSEIQPHDLHLAMLLLGAKGSGDDQRTADQKPPAQIDAEYLKKAPKLRGDPVSISVRWKDGDGEKVVPVEDWIFNTATNKSMARGPWTYNGSRVNDGLFLAQVEGAFAALVNYPSALINNPRQGSDDDGIWTVNEKTVPAIKTPVEITIELLSKANPKTHP
jgi:hypothetical protein